MKKDFYTSNALVVLNDNETFSTIDDSKVILFNESNIDWICDIDNARELLTGDFEFQDGSTPKDKVYGSVSISFLLDFYLKHREEHGDDV